MFRSLTALALFFLLSGAAYAQTSPATQPAGNMKHMVFKQPESPKPAPEENKAEEKKPAEAVPPPARKPLSVEDALRKPEQLQPWSHTSDVVLLNSAESVDKMVRIVEADPGAVPPQGLLFLAKALSEQGRMDEAALYFYVAQLRVTFDAARWPPQLDPNDVKRIDAEKSKTEDQAQVSGSRTPRMVNPHESIALLAAAIGGPIASAMLADPAKAEAILDRVKAWDESAPYAYLPGYDLPDAIPFEQWKTVLPSVRAGYFARMNQFIGGLKKYKQQ